MSASLTPVNLMMTADHDLVGRVSQQVMKNPVRSAVITQRQCDHGPSALLSSSRSTRVQLRPRRRASGPCLHCEKSRAIRQRSGLKQKEWAISEWFIRGI